MTQINVCIANKQMHNKHEDQLPLPKQGDQNAKRTEETHRQRAGARPNMKRLVVYPSNKFYIR